MALLAHRGITANARDNSRDAIASVDQAVRQNMPLGVEVDIRRTTDGLVLNHDHIEGGALLALSSAATLKAVLGRDAPMSYRDGLTLMGNLPVINLEIKEPRCTQEIVTAALEFLETFNRSHDCIVFSSFLPNVVAEIKHIDGRLVTGLLMAEEPGGLDADPAEVLAAVRPSEGRSHLTAKDELMLRLLDETGANFLNPHWSDLSHPLLVAVEERTRQVIPWTVNDEALLVELSLRPEVAHVITDFPEIVFPRLRKRQFVASSSSMSTTRPPKLTAWSATRSK